MRALIQRVTHGSVTINGEVAGQIDSGLVVLLGVKTDDSEKDAEYLIDKICDLRIFSDSDGKFNDSLLDVNGEALIISQFTLYADTRKGRRPGFTESARPEVAIPLYESFIAGMKAKGLSVQTGHFGADMKVSLLNDGPVTILLDSEDKYPREKK
ncbi:MAG: D-aminoacyl-tRNA deacylase [Lentisphaeraceae bacterium]|nr:D-aminoacyl-tRNA deacylase [Lentisphaeraceae bacterium]